MPIVKCKSYLDVYKVLAKTSKAGELAGRGERTELTVFVANAIASRLHVSPDDTVVDVGCGDGTLLRKLSPSVSKVIGILPSDDEVNRARPLVADLPNCSIMQGLAQQIGLPSGCADQVVSSGVLLLLAAHDVPRALTELARICKPGGAVFVGEMPDRDEFHGRGYGDSITLYLWWVLRNRGVRAFLGGLKQTLRALFTKEIMVIMPKKHFFIDPASFIELAQSCGLVVKQHFRHPQIRADGTVYESETRWDYILKKQ